MSKYLYIGYLGMLLVFAAFSYTFIDYNLTYFHFLYTGFNTEKRTLVTAIFLTFIISFYLFYYLFFRLISKRTIHVAHVKNLIIISVCMLLLSYPAMLSYDIFNYLFTAKVLFFYSENPYIVMPIEFIGDPFLSFTHAANKVALYGPVWILLTGVPYVLGFGNFALTIFNIKLFLVVFYLATCFLIWRMTKNLYSVVFFGLNPLVIIETLVGSHNDIVMIFFALLSFHFVVYKKIWLAILLIIISILIKYATFFLLPVFIYILYSYWKKKKINWQKIYTFSTFLMIVVFLIAPLREEIYPWYAIWILAFLSFEAQKKFVWIISSIFTFSLLLRYTPYMLTGTHFGYTPIIKVFITFVPISIFLLGFLSLRVLNKQNRSTSN